MYFATVDVRTCIHIFFSFHFFNFFIIIICFAYQKLCFLTSLKKFLFETLYLLHLLVKIFNCRWGVLWGYSHCFMFHNPFYSPSKSSAISPITYCIIAPERFSTRVWSIASRMMCTGWSMADCVTDDVALLGFLIALFEKQQFCFSTYHFKVCLILFWELHSYKILFLIVLVRLIEFYIHLLRWRQCFAEESCSFLLNFKMKMFTEDSFVFNYLGLLKLIMQFFQWRRDPSCYLYDQIKIFLLLKKISSMLPFHLHFYDEW